MKLKGITFAQLCEIVVNVSDMHYGGNLKLHNDSRPRGGNIMWRLSTYSSSGPGARRTANNRRSCNACWHAHRDVMQAIFEIAPNARITSALATYKGIDEFNAKYMSTSSHNVGSAYQPAHFGNLCDCGSHVSAKPVKRSKTSKRDMRASLIRASMWSPQ